MKNSVNEPIPVIDLFAGPGGLGEGFSTCVDSDRRPRYQIRLSIEKEHFAHQTLRLRAFFRQFAPGRVPGLYYDVLRGTSTQEALFSRFPEQAARAETEAWQAALGSVEHSSVRERIDAALDGARQWVLIGGPPCQAYSVAGRSRNKGVRGYRADRDERQYLYTEYLQVLADHRPAVFVMENVKGLLSARLRGRRMIDLILEDLSAPSRSLDCSAGGPGPKYRIMSLVGTDSVLDGPEVSDFLVQAELYGVPQARHRVILVGIRSDLATPSLLRSSLVRADGLVSASQVLSGMPALRSGLSDRVDSSTAWLRCLRGACDRRWVRTARRTGGPEVEALILDTLDRLSVPEQERGGAFIAGQFVSSYRPEWYSDGRLEGLCNHSTREHMERDLHRYLYASCFAKVRGYSPKLRHFPADLLPKHDNVDLALNGFGYFADRFRVQVGSRPATTVTSHIAKDGHGFIHPDPAQCRSLSVREAARLQTFPDNYCFTGPRTKQYVQVGNAVPPLLAQAIANSIWTLLEARA